MLKQKVNLVIILIILIISSIAQNNLTNDNLLTTDENVNNDIPTKNSKNTISGLQSEDLEIIENTQTSDSIVSIPEKDQMNPNLIKMDDAYASQTVRVDYQRPVSMVITDEVTYLGSDDGISYQYETMVYTYVNDGYYAKVRKDDIVNDDVIRVNFDIRMKIQNSGTLYFDANTCTDLGCATAITSTYSFTSTIISESVDVNGYINFLFRGTISNPGFSISYFEFVKNDGSRVILGSISDPTAAAIVWGEWQIDEFRFVPDVITDNVRSEYSYTSDSTILHKIQLENWDYNNELTIYKPQNWDFASINPTATVTTSGDDIVITNTVPVTYEVLFTSNNTQFLALEDVTENYLNYPGFEGGWSDWSQRDSPRDFETFEITTDIIYSGAYSLHLSETDTANSHAFSHYLDDGQYYIEFKYYLSGAVTGTVAFKTYLNSAWETNTLDLSVTDRWISVFLYVEIDGKTKTVDGIPANILIEGSSGFGGELYFDDFRILKPSGSIETIGLNEYEFSAAFISWDGYQNPSWNNKQVEWSLRDRTADTEIISKSLTTDFNGIATYLYQGTLEQKEYENRWWSYDSNFGIHSIDHANIDEMTAGTLAIESEETSNTKDGSAYRNELTSVTTYLNPSWNPTGTEDFTNVDFIVWNEYYDSNGISTSSYNFRLQTDGSNYYSLYFTPVEDNWNFLIADLDSASVANSPDITTIDSIYFRHQMAANLLVGNYKIFDQLRFIQAQKSYFTPIPSSDLPYSYETKQDNSNNYWDFSEGTTEGFTTATLTENGYVYVSSSGYGGLNYNLGSSMIIPDVDTMKIHIWINISSTFRMQWNPTSGSSIVTFTSVANTWIEVTREMSSIAGETTTTTPMQIIGNNVPAFEMKLDYVTLYSSDNSDLYETDTDFILSSFNDTRSYYVEIDNAWNYFNDLEYIPKNLTIGDHSLNIAQIYDTSIDLDLVQIPDDFSNSTYTVLPVSENLAIEGLSPPSYDYSSGLLDFFISTNWMNTTVYVYQNGSLLGSETEGIASVFSFANTVGVWNFTYVIDGGNDQFFIEDWLSIVSPDLSLITYYYDIQVLDNDGYVFNDFPLLVYYNSTIVSRSLIPLPGNETFNTLLLTFGNEQGFSFNALNVTIKQSVSSNVFVVLAYLDLIKISFENSGLYTTMLNITSTPGNYSLANNETIYIPRGGTEYWLPPGNYSAAKFELILNSTSSEIIKKSSGFISFIRVGAALSLRSFDASSSSTNYSPKIDNKLSLTTGQALGVGISSSLILYFILSKVGDELWKWVRFKIFRKQPDQSLDKKDFQLRSSSRRNKNSRYG